MSHIIYLMHKIKYFLHLIQQPNKKNEHDKPKTPHLEQSPITIPVNPSHYHQQHQPR